MRTGRSPDFEQSTYVTREPSPCHNVNYYWRSGSYPVNRWTCCSGSTRRNCIIGGMIMTDFVSMHSFQGELVDCRRMQLEFQFSNATKQSAQELAIYVIAKIEKLLCDAFFLDWSWNGRRTKKGKLISDIHNSETSVRFGFYGNTTDSQYNNRHAIQSYNQALFHNLNTQDAGSMFSADYWQVYHLLFDGVYDPEQIRENLFILFNMEDRYMKQYWFGEDVVGQFYAYPYHTEKDCYYGAMQFRIALPCLGSNAVPFSQQMAAVLEGITQIVPDVSGRIALSPARPPASCSKYMEYFGSWLRHCPIGKKTYMCETDWANAYFLRGVEWYNILSPLQTHKLASVRTPEGVVVKMLKSGGSIVTVPKNILQTQVRDLCLMKRYLYNILYPGGTEIPIRALASPNDLCSLVKPRHQWENIPVFKSEIIALPDRILIEYQPNDMN